MFLCIYLMKEIKTKPKQINLSMQEPLYDKVCEHVEEYGFRNIQDFLNEIVRREIYETKIKTFDENYFDKLPLNKEYFNFLENLTSKDFLSEKESKSSLDEMRKRVQNWKKENI